MRDLHSNTRIRASKPRKMASETKRRKVAPATSNRAASSPAGSKDVVTIIKSLSTIQGTQTSSNILQIQQAKNFAVSQAQQEGCTGNFRIFDSPFGNFLVPVIPSRAELGD